MHTSVCQLAGGAAANSVRVRGGGGWAVGGGRTWQVKWRAGPVEVGGRANLVGPLPRKARRFAAR